MYTSFYQLNKKPFQISSDPAFMWLGEKHKEALATLKYGILDNKGFLLLTGDVGTGKTTLINALLQSLDKDIITTSVTDPSLEKIDFFKYIAAAFGIDNEFSTKGGFLVNFRRFLLQANQNGKKVLLIIDEAQLMTQELLEEIRLLSNIEKMDSKLINIFFVGQNEFNDILNREQNRAVRQRLTLNYNIDPLTPDETLAYIHHRLKVAGARTRIFDDAATREVFLYSGGFPRRINVLCDHALLSGYVKEQRIIDAGIIRECAKELKIPAHIRSRDINGFSGRQPPEPPVTKKVEGPPSSPRLSERRVEPVVHRTTEERKNWMMPAGALVMFAILILYLFLTPDIDLKLDRIKQNAKILQSRVTELLLGKAATGVKGSQETPPAVQTKTGNKESLQKMPDPEAENKVDPLSTQSSRENFINPTSSKIIRGAIQPDAVNEAGNFTGTDQEGAGDILKPMETQKIQSSVTSELNEDTGHEAGKVQIQTDRLNTKDPDTNSIEPLPNDKLMVRFKYNTNDFTKEGLEKLTQFAQILNRHPSAKVKITGYTDSDGYEKYNQKLSEFRANIVKSFLMGYGISPEQVSVLGKGSKDPLENNNTAWGRKMNRRVEVEIVD